MESTGPAGSPHHESNGGLPYQNSDAGSQIHSDLELTQISSAPFPAAVSDAPVENELHGEAATPAVSGPPLENELHAEAATPVEDLRAPPQSEAYSHPILDPSGSALLQQEYRSYLERRLPHGGSVLLPASVPLPDSRSESLAAPSTDASASDGVRSSVEITSQYDGLAQRLRRPQEGFLGHPPPPPPPPPQPSGRRTPQILIQRNPVADVIGMRYEQIIRDAAELCEHLRDGRIRATARHNRGKVGVLDHGPGTYHRYEYNFIDGNFLGSDDPGGVLRNVPSDISQRLITVEDLYPDIIKLLVVTFGVNPEFFESHLSNSGYNNGQYNDPSPQLWRTAGMKASYVSLKWYRPAWRLPVVPFSTQDLEDLLNPEPGRLEYTLGKSNDLRIFETEANIFRSEWDLWTDLKTTTRMKRLCGWEERASIWRGNVPNSLNSNCEIVILLLDPLPTLKETSDRMVPGPRRPPGGRSRTSNEYSESQSSSPSYSLADSAEPSSGSRSVNSAALGSRRRLKTQRRLRFVPQWLLRLGPGGNQLKRPPVRVTKELPSQPVIEQIGSRVPFDISLEDALRSPELRNRLRSQLYNNTSSTSRNFFECLRRGETPEENGQFGIVSPLFGIVRRDLLEFIKLLHNILDGVNSEILDDMKMEDRLTIWRQIITRAQLELPEIRRSMQQFFTFLSPATELSDSTAQAGWEGNTDLQECSNQIDEILRRLQTASLSLTSNMALLDSRRSIAEAQNVTRLTELAFLFIPMTFAATLLGMQIDQFENRVPLSTFVILGVSFTGFSYAVRLAIRSMWLRTIVQSSKESIKVYADRQRQPVQRGYVPTSLFLRWLSQLLWSWFKFAFLYVVGVVYLVMVIAWRLGSWLLTPFQFFLKPLIYIGLICIVPVAILWTREMDQGIQIAITVAVLFSVSVLILVPYWRSADPEDRAALPRMFNREFRRFQAGNSPLFSLLLWIGSASVFLVPVVILWTNSVTQGIKGAVTTVMVLTIVAALITYGFYKLVELARGDDDDGDDDESDTESERSLVDD